VPQRQAEYFYGRLCARSALAELGIAGFSVGTGQLRQPLWPEGVAGSITHSRSLAASLVLPASRCNGVGIDIEEVPEDCSVFLSGLVFSPAELACLRSIEHRLPFAAACAIGFSAKESFFKAVSTHVGYYFDFDALRLDAIDTHTGIVSFTVQQHLSDAWQPGRRCAMRYQQIAPGHVLTVFLA
jgi:4'-phosphopantetheinyl transferase EntD